MNTSTDKHTFFMRKAMELAILAFKKEEVPVGAIVVCENQIIGSGYNQTETLKDPTAHAEMIAITSACGTLGGKYLNKCSLYVTLEPCLMCAGAIALAQIGSLIYGASDFNKGFSTISKKILHPKTTIIKGIIAEESARILKDFFKRKRN